MTILELREMEKEGKYLFHGSSELLDSALTPHQAYTVVNGARVPDGAPAVFASPSLDCAIFMGVVCSANCPLGLNSGYGIHDGVLEFRASKRTVEQLDPESSACVYIFDRSNFTEKNAVNWCAQQEVHPIAVAPVSWKDFGGKLIIT